MRSARQTVLQLLMKMESSAYSNLILDHALLQSGFSAQDKRFASNLFYGVIERKRTLDYILSQYSAKPLNKLQNPIINILRMGFYQIMYMDSVPDSAAVNESVALCKQMHFISASGFVNAILRNFLRNDKQFKLPTKESERLSVLYSAPEWLIQQWQEDYGTGHITTLLENTICKPPVYIRVNPLKISDSDFLKKYGDELSISLPKIPVEHCMIIQNSGRLEENDAFQSGLFHVQDLSSQMCCLALAPESNDILLDLCAAPGGKTYTLAQIMKGQGTIFAFDLHDKRVALIQKGAERLSLPNIRSLCGDAQKFNPDLPLADRILCDVPCAGLGVIAKKPEIKYKAPESLEPLPRIQTAILENAARYLKVGGTLVYSTCSLSKKENDDVVERFLETHPDFKGVPFLEEFGTPFGDWKATVFPDHFESDGFFIAKLTRIK